MSTTKQITKSKQPKVKSENFLEDTVYNIDLSRIVPSPFEPQARRRKRFKDWELEELGRSIALQGQLSPILVRPQQSGFEIVYGERRFLASEIMLFQTIKCFVKKLSDAEVIEFQYQENHQRQENNPLDDAFTFKYLQEKEGLSISQLADKFGTSQRNVADKLKLNDLIPEAVKQLEDGHLPLKHAYYLAKFPDAVQEEIVREAYAYKWNDISDGAAPFDEFKEEVEENILRRLENAPFNTEDSRLHIKGLICRNCPERTGFEKLLFPDLEKEDSCLNKSCFESKTNIHLRLKRDEIALNLPNPENLPIEKLVERVPIVTDRSWANETPFKAKPLTGQTYLEEPECISSEPALIADGERKGQETFICRDKSCEIHNPKSPQSEKSVEIPAEKLKNLEQDFNRKVSQEVRREVFAAGMKFFTDTQTFWQFADLTAELIYQFLNAVGSQFNEKIFELVKSWENAPKDFSDKEQTKTFIYSLDKEKQSRILFLLTFRDTLFPFFSKFEDDTEIRKICAEYTKLDYKLLDAQKRLKLAPEEFKETARGYLRQVEEALPCSPPFFWYDDPSKMDNG